MTKCDTYPSSRSAVDFGKEQKIASTAFESLCRVGCSLESRHQDPGFPFGMGKRPLGRADKVTPSPPETAPEAGLELANMEEKWSFKTQSSDTYLTVNIDKYMLMPFAYCSSFTA